MAGKLRRWVSQNSKNVDRIVLAHEKASAMHSQSSQPQKPFWLWNNEKIRGKMEVTPKLKGFFNQVAVNHE